MKIKHALLLLLLCMNIPLVQSDVLLRMSLQQGIQQNNVDIRLFENVAPLTVANFLKYSNNTTSNGGNYDNTFFHRSIKDFIVQGGGFSYDPLLNDGTFSYDNALDSYPGGLQKVAQDNPVVNEFSLSNIKGTIAMAKLGDDPDSATNQWFINLDDNSANLDNQNGGFTVFGEVIGNGVSVIESIASVPVFNKTAVHPSFGALPLLGYIEPDNVISENLVRLNSVTQLFSISEDLNFGLVKTGDRKDAVIIIENTGAESITIANIASTNTLVMPFTIVSNNCSNTTLAVAESCQISIDYSPQLEKSSQDSFNIEFTSPVINLEYKVSGAAVDVLAPNISASHPVIDLGVTQLYDPEVNPYGNYVVLYINNEGALDLNISSVVLDGPADFELIDNCTTFSPVVPGGFCVMPVYFKPQSVGEKSATLTIISDDPDENPLIIPISGISDIDIDGIAAAEEDLAPNNGDGDFDGIADSVQNNVSSFVTLNDTYITLVTASGNGIKAINILEMDELAPAPDDLDFSLGVFGFEVDLLSTGSAVEVGIILPAGVIPETYYMYGPTPTNTNPHWYEFMYDELTETGAIIYGDVGFISPVDGRSIKRSVLKLIFKDGARGDADLLVNGSIVDPGGPVIASGKDSSGGLSICILLGLILIKIMRDTFSNMEYRAIH